jgi:hypothetical protein
VKRAAVPASPAATARRVRVLLALMSVMGDTTPHNVS